jgi:hypothetical protein
MSYGTTFEGQLHVYRAESPELAVFLKAIQEGDLGSMGPLGDWLIDHDDPRGPEVARLGANAAANLGAFWRLFGLKPEHAAYLRAFHRTRRMARDKAKVRLLPDPIREAVGLPVGYQGGYFVGGRGDFGQEEDESILRHSYNVPPEDQPGLWCHWTVNEDGTALVADGDFGGYSHDEWVEYLIEHFLQPWGYVVNGQVKWQGSDPPDHGAICVVENMIEVERDQEPE